MNVSTVPPMVACPGCGLVIEVGSGAHGLALHECVVDLSSQQAEEEARMLVREAALDPELSPATAAEALFRVAMLRLSKSEGPNATDMAKVLNAMARVQDALQASGDVDGSERLRQVLGFEQRG